MSDQFARTGLAPPPVRRKLRLWPLLLGLGLVLPLLSLPLPAPPPQTRHAPARLAPTVRVASAARGDVPIVLQGLGVVTPFATVTLHAQIGGTLQAVNFREGQTVHEGDLLAQIDPRPYEAAVAQVLGQLQHDQALLDQAETDLARYRPLLAHDDISRQKYEDQSFLVRQYRGTIAADQAQILAANVNLGYCRIVAPISGRIGLRLVDAGNFVPAGQATGLAVIAQVQPISVIFPLPQDDLPRVMRRMESGAELPVEVYDHGGHTLIERGTMESMDNEVDVATGTAKLRARFANRENLLFPSQSVVAHLLLDTLHDAVVVPEAAIQEGSDGRYVWLLGAHHRVKVRRVTTGPAADGRIAVLTGLEAGARVVTDGADALREGATVAVAGEAEAE